MDRREFLTARKPSGRATPPSPTSGLTPYAGAWTRTEVQQILKRTMFGSTKNDIDYFSNLSLNSTVNELVNSSAALPAPPVNDYSNATIIDPAVSAGQTWINAPTNDGTLNSVRMASFKKWWTGVLLNQDRSIREKMTLFWANHFGTETNDIGNAHYVYHHHDLLRRNALGNYKQLVRAVTTDAGMLRYLNGYLNTATAPDENYGRELQELFTQGKEASVKYTEDDVKKAARVLTGWRINGTTFSTFFDPSKHDSTPKSFSAYYNNVVIMGRSGANGAMETDDLISMLLEKEEVSKHVCRKLYRWFIYYKIGPDVESAIIEPLAAIFRNSNYDIRPVLKALLQSEHFFDAANRGCFIKSPADLVIGTLRECRVVFPNSTTDYADAYGMWNYIFSWMVTMNQNLGDPPNVSGWPAYYQAPQFHEYWINSDTLPKRNKFTDIMVLNGYTRNGKKIIIDTVALVATLPNPADPNALIDDLLGILYRVPLSSTARQTIKQQILLTNQVADHYWTDAWNTYVASPNQNNFAIVNTRLKSLLQYLMNLAEYQLA